MLQADSRPVPELGRDQQVQQVLEAVQPDDVAWTDLPPNGRHHQAGLFPVAKLLHRDSGQLRSSLVRNCERVLLGFRHNMPLCRVSTIVIPNYPQRTKTHPRDPGPPVSGRAYRGRVDIELILDAAGAEVPGLYDLAHRFLKAEAGQLGVSLDPTDVLARRTEGEPEFHVVGAADELVKHLAAEPDASATGAPSWCWPTPALRRS